MLKKRRGRTYSGESALHRNLKRHYARPGDEQEVRRHGYIIDIARPDCLVEIQTSNFAAIKRKLLALTAEAPVLLVHPIAQTKWLLRQDAQGKRLSRRRSPSRGRWEQCFAELVRFPNLLTHPNFELELALVEVEELRCVDGRGSWRRRGESLYGRRLLRILEKRRLERPADYAALLPPNLSPPFTTRQLAEAAGLRRRLAGQMTYCLREMGVLSVVGKKGNAYLYTRSA